MTFHRYLFVWGAVTACVILSSLCVAEGRHNRHAPISFQTQPNCERSCRQDTGTDRRQARRLQGHSLCAAPRRLGALEAAQSDAPVDGRQKSFRLCGRVLAAQTSTLEHLHARSHADERGLSDAEYLGSSQRAQRARFFWIYGGALVGGASREPMYNGDTARCPRHRRSFNQLSIGCLRLARASRTQRRVTSWSIRQLSDDRSDRGTAMGPARHSRLGGDPSNVTVCRRICGRAELHVPDGRAHRSRAVSKAIAGKCVHDFGVTS